MELFPLFFLLKNISPNPARNISNPPMASRHPNTSFESNAALTVPKIISDKTSIEKSPAPILLGLHKITIFDGIKKSIDNIKSNGNISIQEKKFGNGPNASEKINEVNKVTSNP